MGRTKSTTLAPKVNEVSELILDFRHFLGTLKWEGPGNLDHYLETELKTLGLQIRWSANTSDGIYAARIIKLETSQSTMKIRGLTKIRLC